MSYEEQDYIREKVVPERRSASYYCKTEIAFAKKVIESTGLLPTEYLIRAIKSACLADNSRRKYIIITIGMLIRYINNTSKNDNRDLTLEEITNEVKKCMQAGLCPKPAYLTNRIRFLNAMGLDTSKIRR